MTPNDPRHGESSGYAAHERDGEKACDPCHDAWLRRRRRRKKLATRGVPARVPIGDKNYAKLQHARAAGMTIGHIADALGVSLSCAWRYCTDGPQSQVLPSTWLKIDAFRPQPVLTTVGMVRRIQALHHLGYSCAHVARFADCSRETLQEALRDPGRAPGSRRLREAVAAMYEQFWNVQCPDSIRITNRARNRAAREGWAVPLAWDDETIDDPNARPQGMQKESSRPKSDVDEAAVVRAMGGDRTLSLSMAERAEVSRRLRAAGWSFSRIEEHTGLKADRYLELAA